jgi:hypothetical protein
MATGSKGQNPVLDVQPVNLCSDKNGARAVLGAQHVSIRA